MNEATLPISEEAKPRNKANRPPVGVLIAAFIGAITLISNLDWLGKIWYQEGSLLPSIVCYEVFTSIESVLGVKSDRLATAWGDLAWAYSKVPRYRDAIRAEQQAVAMRSQLLGPRDPNVLILKAHIGEFMAKDKQYDQADKYLAATLNEANAIKNPEPVSKAYILEAMAKSYMLQKRWKDAEDAARQIIPIDDHLLALARTPFDGRELLAEIYSRSGRNFDAINSARESLEIKTRQLKGSSVSLAVSHETLGKIYVASKQPDAAKDQFRQAMNLLEKEYGTSGERIQYWRSRYEHLLNEAEPFDK